MHRRPATSIRGLVLQNQSKIVADVHLLASARRTELDSRSRIGAGWLIRHTQNLGCLGPVCDWRDIAERSRPDGIRTRTPRRIAPCAKETATYRRNWFVTACGIALAIVSQNADISRAAVTQNGDNSANPTAAGADPIIGINNLGRLNITGGDSVTSDVAVIGDLVNGIGLVTVTDFNTSTAAASTWTTNSLMVGDAGTGRLEIRNGAIATVDLVATIGSGDLIVGNLANSVGTVIVDGLGSMVIVGDDTVIGQVGSGTLKIQNEGYVVATNGVTGDLDIFTVGVFGRVELSNGRLRTDVFANGGMVTGSGRLDNGPTAISNFATGHIEVNAGDRLDVNAIIDNDGGIALAGGEINFMKSVINSNAAAEITLRDGGIARFSTSGFGLDSTAGVLATTGGTNDIYGTVRIQTASSKISVSGGSTAVFHDPVTNSGGTIEVFAGSTVVYLQGLTTTGSAALAVTLSDADEGVGSSAIEVAGDASLAGGLTIHLASGFKPSARRCISNSDCRRRSYRFVEPGCATRIARRHAMGSRCCMRRMFR